MCSVKSEDSLVRSEVIERILETQISQERHQKIELPPPPPKKRHWKPMFHLIYLGKNKKNVPSHFLFKFYFVSIGIYRISLVSDSITEKLKFTKRARKEIKLRHIFFQSSPPSPKAMRTKYKSGCFQLIKSLKITFWDRF